MADPELQSVGFPTQQEVSEVVAAQPYLDVLWAVIHPPRSSGRVSPSMMRSSHTTTADHYMRAIKAASENIEAGTFEPPIPPSLAGLVLRAASNESEVTIVQNRRADDRDDSLTMNERVSDDKKVRIAQDILWGIVGHWLGSRNVAALKNVGSEA